MTKKNKFYFGFGILIVIIVILVGYILIDKFMINSENNIGDSYVGIWEHNLITKDANGLVVGNINVSITLKDDYTFSYEYIDIKDDSNSFQYMGTYDVFDDLIYIHYNYRNKDNTDTLFINNGKMCRSQRSCNDYFVKGKNEKNDIVSYLPYIYTSYNNYHSILDSKEKSMVVIDEVPCVFCDTYDPILSQIKDNFDVKIYYINDYNQDENVLNVIGSPTTLFIINGEVKRRFSGTVVAYDSIADLMIDLGYSTISE